MSENETIQTLGEQVQHFFSVENGPLAKLFPNYKERKSQIEMSVKIAEALESEQHGIMEAKTGTGKSLAYSLPAALFAVQNNKKVVISTFTITLQNQLINKELPLIQKILKEQGIDFKFTLAKGRGNYLSRRRLDKYINSDDSRTYAEEAEEIKSTFLETGDRTEITNMIKYVPGGLWDQIRSDGDDCMGQACYNYSDCHFFKARKSIEEANVIVVNHALFCTDLAFRKQGTEGILPSYDIAIFDEGHRVEDTVCNFFAQTISIAEVERLFDRFLDKKTYWSQQAYDRHVGDQVRHLKFEAAAALRPLFKKMAKTLVSRKKYSESSSAEEGDIQLLLDSPPCETDPLKVVLQTFAKTMELHAKREEKNWDGTVKAAVNSYIAQIQRMMQTSNQIFVEHDPEWAVWMELKPKSKEDLEDEVRLPEILSLTTAPAEARAILKDTLFQDSIAVFVSATLAPGGDFRFPAARLGLKNGEYLPFRAESPFNYPKQARLIVPRTIPEPNHPSYHDSIIKSLKQVIEQTKGQTFVLFTSYKQMTKVFDDLADWMYVNGVEPILHERDQDRDRLIEDFKASSNAVLFGTESFWEGVDIPGDDLKCVVIIKIPFLPPNEPLTQARTKRVESRGGNGFAHYSLPMAMLKMEQGFGRLIRTETDTGSVVVLDSRIHTKRYGQQIVAALPRAKRSVNLDDVTW